MNLNFYFLRTKYEGIQKKLQRKIPSNVVHKDFRKISHFLTDVPKLVKILSKFQVLSRNLLIEFVLGNDTKKFEKKIPNNCSTQVFRKNLSSFYLYLETCRNSEEFLDTSINFFK